MNHVTIYRFATIREGVPADAKPWFTTDIPFAVDTFQHGVSTIAQGPDGMMYVSSGSRTDHGEEGKEPNRSKEGETPQTACIWQLDPRSNSPQLKIFARGIRNAFGLCWDAQGRLYATENGPNANPDEELNRVEEAKHYGFPFRFSDWPEKAYPDQPDAPPGQKFEPPFAKFDPHSSPSGVIPFEGELLVARYGNMITLPKDVGFDLVRVDQSGRVTPFLSPVARPTDLLRAPNGAIYICEHQRQLANNGPDGPGRILELAPATDPPPPPAGSH
jgi:glucose/arabinose dehydrogenase